MSVDVENGGLVVAFEGEVHLLALGHAIVELVEIAFALESQTSRLWVGQIHLSMVGFKEHIALLGIGIKGEVKLDRIAIAHFRNFEGAAGLHLCLCKDFLSAFAVSAQFVDGGRLGESGAPLVEFCIGETDLVGIPALHGERLHSGEYAMMDVLHRDAVAGVVVPDSKHTTNDGGVVVLELHAAHLCRRPMLVKVLAVEVVVVVTCGGHDIYVAVGDAHEFVSLLLHLNGVGIAIVPNVHDDVFALDGRFAIGMGQRAPADGLLSVAFNEADIVVGEGAEFLHNFFLGIAILVRTDVNALAAEHRVLAFEVFFEEAVHKLHCLGVEKVEVVHAVLLAAYFGLVLRESQGVCRHVNLGDNLHAARIGQLLQSDKLGLGVGTIFGGQTRIGVAFQAEGSLRLVPVLIEIFLESVVVEVNLECVHFIIGHHLDEVAQIGHGNIFAATIQHEAAQLIARFVLGYAAGEGAVGTLLGQLKKRLCAPCEAAKGRSFYVNLLADLKFVGFFAFHLFIHSENEVASLCLSFGNGEFLAR